MLSGIQGVDGNLRMARMVRTNGNGINLRVRQQLFVILRDFSDPILFGKLFRFGRHLVAKMNNPDLRKLEITSDMTRSDYAASDDSNLDLLHSRHGSAILSKN